MIKPGFFTVFCSLSSVFFFASPACAQSQRPSAGAASLGDELREFVEMPAVSGYERPLAKEIQATLADLKPKTDSLGNVIVTLGSGAPHRLLVAPMDEPGYVVSGITPDGYLRLQRLPQNGAPLLFDQFYAAQPVKIGTAADKWVDGVIAGLSVHLQPGRQHPPSESDLDDVYLDIGAGSAADVRKAGVDLLDPVVMDRSLYALNSGHFLAAPAIGDRIGVAALVELVRRIDPAKLKGALTVAFVTQQWAGARGLQRLLDEVKPDEMIYVGRLTPGAPITGTQGLRRAPRREPGSGVSMGMAEVGEKLVGFAADLKQLADTNKIPFAMDYSAPLFPSSYLPAPKLPERWAHLGIATAWPSTPAELLDFEDLNNLTQFLELYVQGTKTQAAQMSSGIAGDAPGSNGVSSPAQIVSKLVTEYAVSGHEAPVRESITRMLPPWAKPQTDDAGNLSLRVGAAPEGAKTPRILVVAHMDEIGFEVKSVSADGRLEAEWRGGGSLEYFAGHAALVHTAKADVPAVVELPQGWEQPGFQWPRGRQTTVRVDVGARTEEEAEQLGVKVSDSVTIPKKYRPLLGTRANARSFDDRVGCAALVSAAWALGGPVKDRDVTFMWSTGEEEGLLGAAAAAKRLAAEGRAPDYVFAVDTFVSSDSPLESKRFADAGVGKGFVVRAVDNSNIVPRDLVEKVLRLARANQIPVQYGVTGGGNDGAAFLRYGSVDVALGWPLRYSHSPAEVIDTRDLDALARIVAAVARSW